MKIQPEFDVASIISKISIAELGGQKSSQEMQSSTPFSALFEAALQDIDDPQLAATIATLSESGMVMPNLEDPARAAGKSDVDTGFNKENTEFSAFQTVQLMNGRPVITSRISAAASGVPLPRDSSLAAMSESIQGNAIRITTVAENTANERNEIKESGRSFLSSVVSDESPRDTEDYSLPSGKFHFDLNSSSEGSNVIMGQETRRSAPEGAASLFKTIVGESMRARHDPLGLGNLSGPQKSGNPFASLVSPESSMRDAEESVLSSVKFRFNLDTNRTTSISNTNIRSDVLDSEILISNVLLQEKPEVFDRYPEAGIQRQLDKRLVDSSNIVPSQLYSGMSSTQIESNSIAPVGIDVNGLLNARNSNNPGGMLQNIVGKNTSVGIKKGIEVDERDESSKFLDSTYVADREEIFEDKLTLGPEKFVGARDSKFQGIRERVDLRSEESGVGVRGLTSESRSSVIIENKINPLDLSTSGAMGKEDLGMQSLTDSSLRASSDKVDAAAVRNSSNVADRWMNFDDLKNEFNHVIKNAYLERDQSGQTTLRIMLTPDAMGTIEAEIIEKNNSVTVNLIAQNDEVAKLLRDNSPLLKEVLGSNTLVELNVSRDGSESGARYSQNGNASQNANKQGATELSGSGLGEPGQLAGKSVQAKALDTYV